MDELKPGEIDVDKKHPLSLTSTTSLIIGLSTLCVQNDIAQKAIALVAPTAAYFLVRIIQKRRKADRLKEFCKTIDAMIVELETEANAPKCTAARKKAIQEEIDDFRKQKREQRLAHLAIGMKRQ